MKNKNKAVWGSRFKNSTSKIFEQIGASIDIDKRLFREDIFGSIIHTKMLVKQKIIELCINTIDNYANIYQINYKKSYNKDDL